MSTLPFDTSFWRKENLLRNLARLGGGREFDAQDQYQNTFDPVNTPTIRPPGSEGFEAEGQSEQAEVPHLYFDPQKAWDAEQSEEVQRGKRLSEAYKPSTTANDRFEALLNNYPERDKPSFMRKLSASMVGFGGDAKGAQAILDRPFNKKREAWEDLTKGAYQAANLERYENVNQRSLLAAEERDKNADRRTDEYIRRGEAQTKLVEARTAALKFKDQNPELRIKEDEKSGNLFAVNRDGSFNKWVTLPDGRPASGRDLSWEERQNILQDNAIERIDRAGEVRQEVAENKPESALSPSAQRTAKLVRAEKFQADYPGYADMVDIDGDNVTIKTPEAAPGVVGKFFGREDTSEKDWKLNRAIADHIVNGKPFVEPVEDLPTNATPTVPAVRQPKVENKPTQYGDKISPQNGKLPEGRVRVKNKKTGQTGTVPMNELNDYLANGYEKVGM